jgi:transaldolase
MPELTLKALASESEVGGIMAGNGGDCEAVLKQFEHAGIDVDALAAQLQEDGAKAFVNSWHDLMQVIESKSAALAAAK